MAKNVVINGVNYDNVPEVHIPLQDGLGDAVFYDTSEANATAAQVAAGAKFINANGLFTGTMTTVGAQTGTIATKNGTVDIQQGYHNGEGSVGIAPAEIEKIIAGNIKYGVSILGVAGSETVVDTTISEHAANGAVVLQGYQCYVNGQLVTGAAQVPAVAQDSTTKILTIS